MAPGVGPGQPASTQALGNTDGQVLCPISSLQTFEHSEVMLCSTATFKLILYKEKTATDLPEVRPRLPILPMATTIGQCHPNGKRATPGGSSGEPGSACHQHASQQEHGPTQASCPAPMPLKGPADVAAPGVG